MNKPWVLPLLGVLALAVVVENVIFFSSGPDDAAAAWDEQAEQAVYEAATGSAAERNSLEPVASMTLLAWLSELPAPERARNPFLTRAESEPYAARTGDAHRVVAGQPVLEGTLYGASRRVAWVDGLPLSEGDVIGGYQLIRIEPNAVLLRGATRELRLEVRRRDRDAATTVRSDEHTEHGSEEAES